MGQSGCLSSTRSRLRLPAKEGKYALNWTRLSCHRFVANRVRLSLFILAYNLGNFLRRLCLPKAVRHWSLRSVQVKLIKMGGRLVRHSRRLNDLAGPDYDTTISLGLPFEPEYSQYGEPGFTGGP